MARIAKALLAFCGLGIFAIVLVAGPASAQTAPYHGSTCETNAALCPPHSDGAVLAETAVRDPQVEAAQASRALPVTGSDIAVITAVGLGAIGVGVTVQLAARRRRTALAA